MIVMWQSIGNVSPRSVESLTKSQCKAWGIFLNDLSVYERSKRLPKWYMPLPLHIAVSEIWRKDHIAENIAYTGQQTWRNLLWGPPPWALAIIMWEDSMKVVNGEKQSIDLSSHKTYWKKHGTVRKYFSSDVVVVLSSCG